MKKLAAIIAAVGLSLCSLTGCAQSGVKNSAQATAENPMILTLAHGLSETHTVHIAMTEFADKVKERTNGRIQIQIFPNGQLGSENENMEQLMAGVISMTKVSAPGLATYNESYHTFGLPYIFDSTEDFYHVMDSDQMHDFFLSSENDGFVTLTYYTSGARSFYTKNKAIRKPEDLKGLKIRVMQSDNMVKMLQLMGGTGVPMSASEQYSAMQQGVVDGAESNEIDYVGKKYYEVAPVFSRTEHCFSTDFVVASTKFMNSLTDEDRKMIEDAMAIGVEAEFDSWSEMVDESIAEAEEKGIEFVEDVDKEAFAANFKEFQEQIANESTVTRKVYDEIKALREEGSNE